MPRPATLGRLSPLTSAGQPNSPWASGHDGGFGGWTPLPEVVGIVEGTAGAWKGQSAESGASPQDHAMALSAGWGSRSVSEAGEPSSLAPGLLPRPPEPARQLPPDPWALDVPSGVGKEEAINGDQERIQKGDGTCVDSGAAGAAQTAKEEIPLSLSETPLPVPDHTPSTTIHVTEAGEQTSVQAIPAVLMSENRESDPVSRPSSSPSERSRHDELPPESPRTSLDEDPKLSRQQVSRKVSTKIQGLVEHFDGLAKQELCEQARPQTSGGQKMYRQANEKDSCENVEDIDSGEFGEFEEGGSDNEDALKEDPRLDGGHDQRNDRSESLLDPSIDRIPAKIYGPVAFTMETAKLEDMFSSDIPDTTSERIFVPDSIPFDSFGSTEERKTWYRISRYGTMRKHNSGNDDNYVRATWKQSKVRDETLEIVSRWIEEDRMSGRVGSGGGRQGSSKFGWNDSKASGVPLALAFARNGRQKSVAAPATVDAVPDVPREWPKRSARERSTSRPLESRRKSSDKSVWASDEAKDTTISVTPVANFGWNSTFADQDSLASEKKPPEVVSNFEPLSQPLSTSRKSRLSQEWFSNATEPSSVESTPAPVIPASTQPIPPVIQKTNTLSGLPSTDLQDGWGEMISSSVTQNLPAFPPPKALQHKKSRSFGELDSDASRISHASEEPVDQFQSKSIRRTMTDFNQPLIPQVLATSSTKPQVSSDAKKSAVAPIEMSPSPVQSRPAVSNTAVSYDPWASADFSFFEKPAPAPKPLPSLVNKVTTPKASELGNPLPIATQGSQRSREEIEQDRVVEAVVKGLPNLSYMLRK